MRVKGASSREVVCMGKGLRTSMGGVRMGEGGQNIPRAKLARLICKSKRWEGKAKFTLFEQRQLSDFAKKEKKRG